MRSKLERMHEEKKHINRKKKIIKDIWHDSDWILYRQSHRLSKGKIHCSCPMCSRKTNRRCGTGSYGWKPSDQRKLAKGWADDADL